MKGLSTMEEFNEYGPEAFLLSRLRDNDEKPWNHANKPINLIMVQTIFQNNRPKS